MCIDKEIKQESISKILLFINQVNMKQN